MTVQRVAAIDIGTNTVRLLVADVDAKESVEWIVRQARIARLGEGVDGKGSLDEEAMSRAVAILVDYATIIDTHDCVWVVAVATSAVRDASNRTQFLDEAERASGIRPRMITGNEEASLSFSGTTGHLEVPGPYLVIDPGGGSTEFVLGTDTPSFAVSVDIGSVRLTERIRSASPLTTTQVADARNHVDELLADQIRLPVMPEIVFGVAGTYTSLAAISLGLAEYDSDAVHGTALGLDDLAAMTDRLAGMTVDEIARIPSMDPKRAPVMIGGAIVAERSAMASRRQEITVSERDSLDGLARLAYREVQTSMQ